MSGRTRRSRGVTLVELVVSMLIVSVALAGTLSVMNITTLHSADPMIEQQGLSVAEAYLEEILLRAFADPDDGLVCGAPEASRDLYDDVCDYAGHSDAGAADQDGNAVAGLEAYTVTVGVDTAANLNGLTGASDVLRIDVRVTHPVGLDLTLSGYRTSY
jgi:MSHA pilin protein MshD